MEEIILIDKPSGMTSFDVIRYLQRKCNPKPKRDQPVDAMRGTTKIVEEAVLSSTVTEKSPEVTKQSVTSWSRLKMGHAGTLDPLATGLMILGVGKGTKRLTEFIKLDKEYIAEILIGEKRSTGDMEGEVLEEVEVVEISDAEISTAVQSLIGTQTLPVSAYSAIKKDGKPMYKRAREAAKIGELVDDIPFRDMKVYEAELLDTNLDIMHDIKKIIVKVRFKVGSGTYIRSLAEELGRRLSYPATLYSLRRTKIGEFDICDAKKLEDF